MTQEQTQQAVSGSEDHTGLLKLHSVREIERCLAGALSGLTGDNIVVKINELQFSAAKWQDQFAGKKGSVTINLLVDHEPTDRSEDLGF